MYRFGIEIEGISRNESSTLDNELFTNELLKSWNCVDDCSININSDDECNEDEYYFGIELRSPVYKENEIKRFKKELKEVLKYIAYVNKSCGIHIHISSDNIKYYHSLFNYQFTQFFTNEYKRNFKTKADKDRLLNSYCKEYDSEYNFHSCKWSERYKLVNYTAFTRHRTIEFRVFKATTDVNEILRYVHFCLAIIKEWLKRHRLPDYNKRKTLKQEITPEKKEFIMDINKIKKARQTRHADIHFNNYDEYSANNVFILENIPEQFRSEGLTLKQLKKLSKAIRNELKRSNKFIYNDNINDIETEALNRAYRIIRRSD